MKPKITFECLGFNSNPIFIQIDSEEYPFHAGYVKDVPTKEGYVQSFAEQHYHEFPKNVTIEEVLEEYRKQFKEHGVAMCDISKEAWLEERYGEPIPREEGEE